MKLKWLGVVIVLACVLASALVGHATAQQASAASGGNENKHCKWTFDYGINSKKVDASTFQVSPKGSEKCTPIHSSVLYIGDDPRSVKKVLDIDAVEFKTEGNSCRYCYINTSGGMSCVEYPCP